ncbi:MAG: hypothetical protein JW969_19960 [Spirochaetales bacterium]|nr:hypothetical protein [Spirochaetales bacterium]
MDAKKQFVLTLDIGTTNIKAILFNGKGKIHSIEKTRMDYILDDTGKVEQDPSLLIKNCTNVITVLFRKGRIKASDVAAMGISTQRSSFLFWDRETGKTWSNIITWQDKRAHAFAVKKSNMLWLRLFRLVSRLLSYIIPSKKILLFSIMKFDTVHSSVRTSFFLKNNPDLYARIRQKGSKIVWGTIDTWVLWNLTGGKTHSTDYSSASSTGLLDPFAVCWSKTIAGIFGIPLHLLPEVRETRSHFGTTMLFGGGEIPITSMMADQQASLYALGCFDVGDMKCTNGTGSFINTNTGTKAFASRRRLYPLVAWKVNGITHYMLEGQSQNAGNIVDWIQHELNLIKSPEETEKFALSVTDTNGIYFLPAFTTGLTFPYWDASARGTLFGLSLNAKKEHIIRAVLEGICYRIKDIADGMSRDTGIKVKKIILDGGVSQNRFLLQFLSDILNMEVVHLETEESTAHGAAFMAGIFSGFWKDEMEIKKILKTESTFRPAMDEKTRKAKYRGWQSIVRRSLDYLVWESGDRR